MNECTFITGVGTDIGKTHYLCEVLKKITTRKIPFFAIKPIASGVNLNHLIETDSAKILCAMNQKVTFNNFKKITPWYFEKPISPHLASQNSAIEIDFKELKNFCLKHILKKTTFIEGAGGIMAPINFQYTNLDLIKSLPCRVILVTGNYLGSISHTFTALEVIKNNKIMLEKVIINESLLPSITYQDFRKIILQHYSEIIVEYMPRALSNHSKSIQGPAPNH